MEKFIIGALFGTIAGALLVSNNAKMRDLVRKGEEELRQKVETAVDEKLTAALKKKKTDGDEESVETTKKDGKAEKKSKKKGEKAQI